MVTRTLYKLSEKNAYVFYAVFKCQAYRDFHRYANVNMNILHQHNASTFMFPNLKGRVNMRGCETWSLTLREEQRLRMFDNRAQRRIFGPKGDEVTGEWRRLHNEELNDLYSSPNIIRVIKSRMTWAGHVARMGKREMHTGFWWEDLREDDHLGDTGVDGRIILKWIFKKWMGHGLD
jgi:hypothetical protein